MPKELKKYEIRATKKPAKNTLLSSVVVVRNESGEVGYCYINFSSSLVDAVGRLLPSGLSTDRPAYLQALFYQRKKVWLITAEYSDGTSSALLWKTEQKPSWLNFYQVSRKNGPHPSSKTD